MQKWLMMVESNCADPTKDEEFNAWYNNTHLPDVLEGLPEFQRAVRFENIAPAEGGAKYLAIYEIETEAEDLGNVLEKIATFVKEKSQHGRMSDLLQATRVDHFKQIFSLEK